jgi:hypothetical protein
MQGFKMQDRCVRRFILHHGSCILNQAPKSASTSGPEYPASSIEIQGDEGARGEVIADIVWAVNRRPRNFPPARHRNDPLWERLPAREWIAGGLRSES